ncbi:MAG: NADH-quinone oxidoreductase subunit N [Bacteroidetes bacterium GWF2_49_14]|nr:MAG: NADH-quinone oxidoreductase subunit N [Bacteroidetes bacterium GWF2_49_14]
MESNSFFLMRNELILVGIAMILLVAEIFTKPEKKNGIITLAAVLFGLATVANFFPVPEGTLFGGSFITNPMTVFMKSVLNIGVFIVFLQSVTWLRKEENHGKISEYFILVISTLIGMNFMISSGDFLMMYIGLELATIPIAALAAFEKFHEKSAEAGIKLILTSALSSGILLYGLSFIYGTTGSIYFVDIVDKISSNPLQTFGLVFFVAGMAFKISLVPFHLWTADVYEGAPINITAYLSVVSKGAAAFTFMIILFRVFSAVTEIWQPLLYTLAVATMTVGNLFAIRQNNMKRFLAFSSIAQAGFILLGIMQGGELGMTTVVYFMLIYVFTNLAAFGVVSAISEATGKENITDYNSLYKTNPKLSLIMLLAMFSLAGIPPVAGFFGKFFLFTAAGAKGYYILVLIAVLNATVSLYYYLRVVKAMLIDKSDEPIGTFKTPWAMRASLLICVAGIFVIGFASAIYEYISSISFGIN